MELKQLEESLTGYYGEHASEHVQDTTMSYIEGTYTSQAFKTLLREIMKTHPFNYGFPDVSAIEKASEYYYQKNNNKSLKKLQKPENEFNYKYIPLTDEERELAKTEHEKFLEFTKKIVNKKSIKEEPKHCKNCTNYTENKQSYSCRGCIDFSKYNK